MTNKTDITLVIDKSGSMGSLRGEIVGEINNFIDKQKEQEGSATISIYLFDTSLRRIIDNVNIKTVRKLTNSDFQPSGMTALNDSVVTALSATKLRVNQLPKKSRPKVVFAVFTDGYENSSQEFTRNDMDEALNKRKKKGWNVTVVGTNVQGSDEVKTSGAILGAGSIQGLKKAQRYGVTGKAMLAAAFDHVQYGTQAVRGLVGDQKQVEDFDAASCSMEGADTDKRDLKELNS